MLILLPPSETKRLDEPGVFVNPEDFLSGLGFSELDDIRRTLIADLATLSRDPESAVRALKLGPKLAGEVALNLELERAPRLPALERYTGVLFDPLAAAELTVPEREYAARHIAIQSAPFGLIGGMDPIPNYRLSAGGRVPPVALKKRWAEAGAAVLGAYAGFILDLRSEAYAALAPLTSANTAYLRVVAALDAGLDGPIRALNHFNKKTKGVLTRAMIADRVRCADAPEFLDWCSRRGFRARAEGTEILFEELR